MNEYTYTMQYDEGERDYDLLNAYVVDLRQALKQAEAELAAKTTRVEQLEREVNEEWVTRGMPSWRSRAKRAEAELDALKSRRCEGCGHGDVATGCEEPRVYCGMASLWWDTDESCCRWTPREAAE